MRKDSKKRYRINEEIKKELSNIIRCEVKDPNICLITSVTGVSVTNDLKECKVYISILGSNEESEKTMNALNRSKGYIRRCLAKNLNLRNTPELIMIKDDTIEHGMYIDSILENINTNDKSY